ncbi:hypothetical protein ACJMK2_021293 [Sinanodonta woodiana]|uniref:WD repeat-containing protein 60 n=1 Tax=Sinanodonta woodiana TaxID=1069815 RepID=A0ABD3THL6_SINWO
MPITARDDRKSHRDQDDDKRRRSDVNGDDKHRRRRDDDGIEKKEVDVNLTEDERERLRRERREKREKTGKKDGKEIAFRRGDDERLKGTIEDDQSKSRHRDEDDRRKRHSKDEDMESRRKQRDDDEKHRRQRDDDDDKQRRHRDDDDKRRHSKEDKDRERRKHKDDEEDEERRRRHDGNKDRRKEDDKDKRKDRDDRKHRRDKLEKDNADDDDYNYEDDFEDSEVDEILRALDEENNRLLNESHKEQRSESTGKSSNRYQGNSDEEEDNHKDHSADRAPAVSRTRTVINFVSAKQRAMSRKTANKTIQRGRDLLQMLELDVARFDLLDLPPVKEYDLYIRSFGRTDTKQAYVQTNDDNIDRDIQTEEIDSRQKWTQHPPEDFLGVGRGDGEKDFEEEEQSQMKQNKEQDLGRLHKFLASAGQVMGILLDEKRDEETRGESGSNKSSISVSEGYSQLVVLNILAGRYVEFACFSPTQPNFLLTLYSKPQTVSEDKPVDKRGIICVWNTNEPFYPQKILACESQPKCCCFSPVKPTLVFAGMVDGSIAVWDLREIASLHKSVVVDNQEYLLRFPTYDTAGILDNENHHSPVNSICPVYSYMTTSSSNHHHAINSSAGLSFQLVSTEDMAVLHFWVVAEIMHPDPSGSESDLGLAPGGQVKLLKSSSLTLDGPARDGFLKTSMRALSMQLLPSDPNQFYIATDLGFVFHGLRFSSRAYPNTHSAEIQTPLEVTCIDFSPFEKPCFLVSLATDENPIMTWSSVTQGRPILSVMWSRSRPCLFFVFDDSSNMYIFDLLERDATPKHIEKMSKERVVSVACSTDHKATGLGIPGRLPQLFISLESGKTEIHTFAKSVRESEPLEAEFLEKFLDRF